MIEERVVTDRVFLLGLDQLYRNAMRVHEGGDLLDCVRCVAEMLHVDPAPVPVEGYYGESPELTEYFLYLRALQDVPGDAATQLEGVPQFARLRAVTSSRLYGLPRQSDRLLPAPRDAVSTALHETRPWTIDALVAAAHRAALESDDFSLVALAARAQDAVALAAVRESVVLYAEIAVGSSWAEPFCVWRVNAELARLAGRFVSTFNALFEDRLPAPQPEHAQVYWSAAEGNEVVGRCVRLGVDSSGRTDGHYHWGICRRNDGTPVVHEFWSDAPWTTARYRSTLRGAGYRPRS